MIRTLPAWIGLAVVLLTGFVHGVCTSRWQFTHEPRASAAKLEQVPMTIGNWTSQSVELDAQTLAIGKIAGYLRRVFVNQRTGQEITCLVVCGRPGPITQHSPEICYGGEGFELIRNKTRRRFSIETLEQPAEFWVGDFRKIEAGLEKQQRLFWSWNANGPWLAPDSPRIALAAYPDLAHFRVTSRFPALYKIYVGRLLERSDERVDGDPAVEFMNALLPELQRVLFKNPTSS
jgi:hypothetical protein